MNADDPQRHADEGRAEPDGFVDENGRLGWEQYQPKPVETGRPMVVRRVASQLTDSEPDGVSGPRIAAVGVMVILAAVVTAGVAVAMGAAVLGWIAAAIAFAGVAMIAAGYRRFRRS